jgi:uncharacterized membrane protein YfhO
MAAYNWDVMWLDVVVLAPVIILGLERLVYEGKCHMYCVLLAMSILSNYYLSIMLCIFLVLYFVVLLISEKPFGGSYPKAFGRFIGYSLIAGGMSAILLFPEISSLMLSEFSEISFPTTIKTYFSVFDMLARHSFNVAVETGLDHWPNIYCGVAVFFLVPLYVIQPDIPIRQKASRLLLVGFMLISFSTNLLNFIWHGFNYPDSLPARQSFLYIFMILVMSYEAFMHIQDYSPKQLFAVLWGVVFFLILFEKLIDDDAFVSTCFIVTGIFLAAYALLCLGIRHFRSTPPSWLVLLMVIVCVLEAWLNTNLTSVPTVSRTTYLSNYDSYQTLTKRTVESEDGDFFRFEKFARRTQNDAMLIGFQAASYFSSTINSHICDFYEKYGMRGSKVNYCFEGATPVMAALLSNRYMLYTSDRGYDNLFELCDTEGNLYLYKNNYSLPLGYMVTEGFESDADNNGTNPIEKQIQLVKRLGIEGDVFTPIEIEDNGSEGSVYIEENAHYYAYTSNTKIDTIKMNFESESKNFSQIKKKYILDLGYHESGDILTLKSENGESLNLKVYKLNEDVLSAFTQKLGSCTLDVKSYDETSLYGSIDVESAGYLVMSVPYDPSWTLYVDGVKTDYEAFEDALISVYLEKGSHSIELKYFPDGLIAGIAVSVISIAIFAALIAINKKHRKQA